jgi:glutamate/tyrosine decarboxylase-like PLP-dependent enzyme
MKKVVERLRAPIQTVRETARRIKQEEEVELCLQPDTGILCFRIVPGDLPENRLDLLQEFIYGTIMSEGMRAISKAKLGPKTVLRLVAISPAITAEDLMETVVYCRAIAKRFFVPQP